MENKNYLTEEEKQILESYDADEWKPIHNLKSQKADYMEYAKEAFKKNNRVNIRISSQNLDALKYMAIEEGIPYQTLISSILHKYVHGRLTERR